MNKQIVRCSCGKETTVSKGSPANRKWKYRLPYKVREEGLAEGWYCGNPKHHNVMDSKPFKVPKTGRISQADILSEMIHK